MFVLNGVALPYVARKAFGWMFALLVFVGIGMPAQTVRAADMDAQGVLQQFSRGDDAANEQVLITQRERHTILFFMGITLLVLILTTASLGLAMALRGKQVFVAHMVCAGLTVFLAVAHAVTSIVWFYPFQK